MTASLVNQAPPVPLAGRADMGVQGVSLEVMEQPVMVMIPLLMVGRTGLPTALVVPTVVGATLLVVTPPTQVEVAAAVTDGSQLDATEAALEAPA